MLVLVCGDRDWTDRAVIHSRLFKLKVGTTILHGDARGADRIGGQVATHLGLEVIAMPADWKQYGKMAGVLRNRAMLDRKPDLVLAFHDDIENSSGTRGCVKEAAKRGIPVELICHGEL